MEVFCGVWNESAALCKGEQGEQSDAAAATCTPSTSSAELFCEAAERDHVQVQVGDWVSPRVSFSQDFVIKGVSEHVDVSSKESYSAEFDFLKYAPASYGAPNQAKGFMLTADQLFFDGKLLPLIPFPSAFTANVDDLSLSLVSCGQHSQEATLSLQATAPVPGSSRPLKSSSSLSFCLRSKCACISLPCDSTDAHMLYFPSSSQQASTLPSLTPSLSSSSTSAVSLTSSSSSVTKCSTKFKALFKSKRSSKDSQFTRDSISSSCKLPISSTTFWPFSRSNSAGESKIMVPPPLPCRSNSAGDSPSLKELDVARLSTSSAAVLSKDQAGSMVRLSRNKGYHSKVASSSDGGASDWKPSNTTNDNCVDSSCKASGKRIVGSPAGRRGASGVKANGGGGKSVLRNLERCSAERKLGREVGWRGLNRRGSFPVGARVSPVLNVAVYRGSSGLFGFNSLPFSKKEKPTEAAINWRNGA